TMSYVPLSVPSSEEDAISGAILSVTLFTPKASRVPSYQSLASLCLPNSYANCRSMEYQLGTFHTLPSMVYPLEGDPPAVGKVSPASVTSGIYRALAAT